VKKTTSRILCALIALALLSVMLVSCAAAAGDSAGTVYDGGSYSNFASAETYAPSMKAESEKYYEVADDADSSILYSSASSANGSSMTVERKIVKTVNLTLETKDFDGGVKDLVAVVEKMGGYVESSYISGNSMNRSGAARYADYTFRVPAETLSSYVDSLEEKYNVVSRSENAADITDSYYDSESRLKSLLTREERLIELLDGAKDLQYMLEVERELAQVRYEIENYYSTLKRYDSQVAMSTVRIHLEEVVEYKAPTPITRTFGERFIDTVEDSWDDFLDGCEDFLFWLIYALPGLVVFAIVVVIIVIIVRTAVKRAVRKRAKKAAEKAEAIKAEAVKKENESK